MVEQLTECQILLVIAAMFIAGLLMGWALSLMNASKILRHVAADAQANIEKLKEIQNG